MRAGGDRYQRLWRLLEMLHQYHEISIRDAQSDEQVNASKTTLHEDFDALAALGLAERVPGAIRTRTKQVWTQLYFGRNYETLVAEGPGGERRRLAGSFADRFGAPYQTVLFGNGTSCLAAAEELVRRHPGVTLITTNLAIAQLMRHQLTLLVGGTVEPEVAATGGDFAVDSLERLAADHVIDVVVLSASGLVGRPLDDGRRAYKLTCQWEAEKKATAAMLAIGKRPEVQVALLVGQAKLGHQDLLVFGDLADLGDGGGDTPRKVSILTSKMNADERRSRWLDEFKKRIDQDLPHVELVFVPTASGGTNEGSER